MIWIRLSVEVVQLVGEFGQSRKVVVDVFDVVRKPGGFLVVFWSLLTEHVMA
jgi:hypothetical protein